MISCFFLFFVFRREPCRSRASPASGLQVSAAYVAPQKVLIVNTNGGGHANIGFWLSKTLAGEGEEEEEGCLLIHLSFVLLRPQPSINHHAATCSGNVRVFFSLRILLYLYYFREVQYILHTQVRLTREHMMMIILCVCLFFCFCSST